MLQPEKTGITFINEILEDEYINIISYEYLYNGAGIGIGDFNNDGLQDIFFCGNMVSNRLYMNKGNLRFEDITKSSGIEASDRWCTGVAIVDINTDGWKDIYVCASYNADPQLRKNMMFLHNGLDQEGLPSFTQKATEMGIDDDGFSTNAAFFDSDNDGDLDLYVLTNMLDTDFPNKYRPKKDNGTSITNDRFYRNIGDGTFINSTLEAGIRYEGYGLGISIVDLNQDGWKDIYITNDYLTNDLLYINNQDGTFSNQISSYLKHMGHSAMGHDIADINNDALPDIYTLDMLPEDNQRLKQMYAGSRFNNNAENDKYDYDYQYKRNVLQLNNGADASGNHLFSEIGLFADVYATDWSWSALLADFDNDGFRDLFISNGYPRDVTDLDYATTGSRRGMWLSMEEELENIPVRHIHNYIFKNTGNYSYIDKSEDWGFGLPSYSSGAAYVDLDNDGDLDLVTSNINEPAAIYENKLYSGVKKENENNYLRIKLVNRTYSGTGLGTLIYVFMGGQVIYDDHTTYHGFLSTMEPIIHVGLGEQEIVDSLLVISPYGKAIRLLNVPVNQVLELDLDTANDSISIPVIKQCDTSRYIVRSVQDYPGIRHYHMEEPFNDFNIQPTLPFQLSQSGPAASAADVDGNGEFDLFIGGSKKYPGSFYLQFNGTFVEKPLADEKSVWSEDQGVLLFDADNDGDNDLFLISGSNELDVKSPFYSHRFYVNEAEGNFARNENALPDYLGHGTCVKGADIDSDGDIDLFIGGAAVPGSYPYASQSYILRNISEPDKPEFIDITVEFCPDLEENKLIKDALWTDFNNDSKIDLIVTGEWMPVTLYRNNGHSLENVTDNSGIGDLSGWWNSLAGGDFDNDGDTDYMAGNHGLNSFYKASSEEPLIAYAADFDNNGRSDIIIAAPFKDIDGSRKVFPVHFRNDINRQIELMKKRFPSFKEYSDATIDSLFSEEELKEAIKLFVNHLESVYIENLGNNKFKMHSLPIKAQFAPLYGIHTGDFNNDQYLDAFLVGNFYGNNPFWGRIDAFNGLLLAGKGNSQFEISDYPESGFLVQGDAKAIIELPVTTEKNNLLLVTQNQDSVKTFIRKQNLENVLLDPGHTWAEVIFKDGSRRRQEFYYGNTYLSQSARVFQLTDKVKSYKLHSYIKDR
jgi:hypothetical protein